MKKLPPSKESITRRFDLGEELETDFGDNDQSAAPLRALDVSTTSRADTAYVMEAALPGEIEHPEAFRPTINATRCSAQEVSSTARELSRRQRDPRLSFSLPLHFFLDFAFASLASAVLILKKEILPF
jgi:hypothetical protein